MLAAERRMEQGEWYWYRDDGTRYVAREWQPALIIGQGYVRLFWGCCEESLFNVDELKGEWGPSIPEPPVKVNISD